MVHLSAPAAPTQVRKGFISERADRAVAVGDLAANQRLFHVPGCPAPWAQGGSAVPLHPHRGGWCGRARPHKPTWWVTPIALAADILNDADPPHATRMTGAASGTSQDACQLGQGDRKTMSKQEETHDEAEGPKRLAITASVTKSGDYELTVPKGTTADALADLQAAVEQGEYDSDLAWALTAGHPIHIHVGRLLIATIRYVNDHELDEVSIEGVTVEADDY